EMRAALDDLARDFDPRLAGIVAFLLARAARVDRQAARPLLRVGSDIPVRGPLPDIADHVVEAVAVGREGAHRGGAFVAVLAQVLPGELALPGVCHRLAVRLESIPPGKLLAVRPAPPADIPP